MDWIVIASKIGYSAENGKKKIKEASKQNQVSLSEIILKSHFLLP